MRKSITKVFSLLLTVSLITNICLADTGGIIAGNENETQVTVATELESESQADETVDEEEADNTIKAGSSETYATDLFPATITVQLHNRVY